MTARAEVDGKPVQWCEEDERWVFIDSGEEVPRSKMDGPPVVVGVGQREFEVAFAEWDRRYREEPETFMNEVQHLLGETPESYGKACGLYFAKLLWELR